MTNPQKAGDNGMEWVWVPKEDLQGMASDGHVWAQAMLAAVPPPPSPAGNDLVERLETMAKWLDDGLGHSILSPKTLREAATRLSDLEQMRRERDKFERLYREKREWIDVKIPEIEAAEARISSLSSELAKAREALSGIAIDLQSSIDTHEFNSRHMIAEDSLQDAWKMLDMAREQFQVDANSLQVPLRAARAALKDNSNGEGN